MFKTVLLSVSLIFTLSACSRIDLAYNWVDTFIASKVDDYFDISSQQSKNLKASINKDLKNIQSTVVPQLIDHLKEIEKDVAADHLNEERIAHHFASVMTEVEKMNSHFSQTAVHFIADIKPEQISYFEKSFTKKLNEDFKKIQDSEKNRKESRKKYISYFEDFVGNLSEQQKKSIDTHLATKPFPAHLKAKNKEYALQQFLKHKDSPEKMASFVQDYYDNPEAYDLPEYRTAFIEYQKDLKHLLVMVLGSLSPDQKKNLQKSLAKKTEQLERISRRT